MRDHHLEILKKGVSEWNEWRLENPDITPHLFQADLTFLRTQGIAGKLVRRVSSSDLEAIETYDFRNCLIYESDFTGTVLVGADFSGSLGEAAKLIDCDLRLASFEGSDFSHSDFTRSRLNQAVIGSKKKNPATFYGRQNKLDRARSPARVFSQILFSFP